MDPAGERHRDAQRGRNALSKATAPARALSGRIIVDPDQRRTDERIGSDLGTVRRRGGLFLQSRRVANAQRSGTAGARKLRDGASSRSKPLAGGATLVRLP